MEKPKEDGHIISMQASLIVSLKRSTDILAFYADWLFHRLKGEYKSCPHLCEYCYANATKEMALQNWKRH